MDSHRAERISETIREELSEIVGYETGDPRLLGVAITDVHLSPDLRHAHVAVIVGAQEDMEGALSALDAARHYLRRELARRIDIYRIPELHFGAATNIAAAKVGHLLKRIHRGRPKDTPPDSAVASPGPSGLEEKKPIE